MPPDEVDKVGCQSLLHRVPSTYAVIMPLLWYTISSHIQREILLVAIKSSIPLHLNGCIYCTKLEEPSLLIIHHVNMVRTWTSRNYHGHFQQSMGWKCYSTPNHARLNKAMICEMQSMSLPCQPTYEIGWIELLHDVTRVQLHQSQIYSNINYQVCLTMNKTERKHNQLLIQNMIWIYLILLGQILYDQRIIVHWRIMIGLE